jgi:ribonucleoside-triphosphate reductase
MTPWSTIGYLTYKRTYARTMDDGTTEEWPDTIERVISACDQQLGVAFTKDEEDRLREYMLKLKFSVAGRFLWQLGTATVDRHGMSSLQNCAFTRVDSPVRPFTWAMDMLALGCGVGFSIQREHVSKLPKVRQWFDTPTRVEDASADFIVPDTREGWVKLLGKTLKAAFLSQNTRQGSFTYSTMVVRSKDKPIKGFGGKASGPEHLVWGITQISEVLKKRAGQTIRPIDALDIMNIIGAIIVSGNVRRSAMIALGDPDDIEYLLAKRWDFTNIPSWRAMSNNSVVCNHIGELHEFFWEGYQGKGEPYGIINLRTARKFGRTGEIQYPDPSVEGVNPCSEQTLGNYESCCLSEVFLPNVESKEEFLDILELSYRINKHSLALHSHHGETQEIVHKNFRMGIGLTGILQATKEQLSWLDEGYKYLREFDESYSWKNGFPRSVKITSVKPSGTLSLLPGVTPGIHPGYAQYMIRRIRIAAGHPLVDTCRKHGYHVEYVKNFDGSADRNTVVVEFPFKYPEGTVLAKDLTAIEQLEWVRKIQREWADNAVSVTCYYKKEELPEIRKYLEKYWETDFKALSFLLHSEHGFLQAPYEEISKEQYEDLIARTKLITKIESAEFDENDADCVTGACPVR